MDKKSFMEQILKLIECFGDKSYPMPRVDAMYLSLKHFHIGELEASVIELINTSRRPPLLPDILEVLGKVRSRKAQQGNSNKGVLETLQDLENPPGSSDPKFKDLCMEAINQKLKGNLQGKKWEETCDYIEKVYQNLKKAKRDETKDSSQGEPD